MIEIDGIRHAMHLPNWESGDAISDNYWELLETVTSPNQLSTLGTLRIQNLADGLNRNLGNTALLLDMAAAENGIVADDTLHTTYDSVVGQVNEILSSNAEIPTLEPLSVDSIMARPIGNRRFIKP